MLRHFDGHKLNTIGHNLNFIDWSQQHFAQSIAEVFRKFITEWKLNEARVRGDQHHHHVLSYTSLQQQLHNQASDDGKLKLNCVTLAPFRCRLAWHRLQSVDSPMTLIEWTHLNDTLSASNTFAEKRKCNWNKLKSLSRLSNRMCAWNIFINYNSNL